MHIFIDESGTFSGFGGASRPSVVGALIIPDMALEVLTRDYDSLREHLPKDKGEVKGRQLSETHVAAVIELLRSYPVLFEATVIETGLHTPAGIETHRNTQAQAFTRNIDAAVHDQMRRDLWSLRQQLERFPLQLYVQSTLTFELIATSINHSSLYFVQRYPEELATYHWVIDAKDCANPITPWEQWWSGVVAAMLQAKSARSPMLMLEGADYSHFRRFETEWADWAFPNIEAPGDGKAINIKQIMQESFRFSDEPEPGLELVDVLTNALRRTLLGKLRIEGWQDLPRLMAHRPSQYFQLITLEDLPLDRTYSLNWPIAAFSSRGKSLIV